MSAGVTRNFRSLETLGLSSEDLMHELGDLARRIIRTRTEAGIAVDGSAFVPLSDGYAMHKQRALGHQRADLTVSGRMLNDMGIVELTPDRVTLGFHSRGGKASGGTFVQRSRAVGAADKANWHQIEGAGKSKVKRPFFDLSPAEEAELTAVVQTHLAQTLESIGLG